MPTDLEKAQTAGDVADAIWMLMRPYDQQIIGTALVDLSARFLAGYRTDKDRSECRQHFIAMIDAAIPERVADIFAAMPPEGKA